MQKKGTFQASRMSLGHRVFDCSYRSKNIQPLIFSRTLALTKQDR